MHGTVQGIIPFPLESSPVVNKKKGFGRTFETVQFCAGSIFGYGISAMGGKSLLPLADSPVHRGTKIHPRQPGKQPVGRSTIALQIPVDTPAVSGIGEQGKKCALGIAAL